jgi:hypothetical protein
MVKPLLAGWATSDPEAANAFAAAHGLTNWKPAMNQVERAKQYEGRPLADAARDLLQSGEGEPDFNTWISSSRMKDTGAWC